MTLYKYLVVLLLCSLFLCSTSYSGESKNSAKSKKYCAHATKALRQFDWKDGRISKLETLLQQNADPNIKLLGCSSSPITSAAYWGNTDAITALLRYGATINFKDNNGDTALHSACRPIYERTRKNTIKFLIANGASVHTKDDRGETPLDVLFSTPCTFQEIFLLMHHGAPISETTIQYARSHSLNEEQLLRLQKSSNHIDSFLYESFDMTLKDTFSYWPFKND